ncbi:type 1 glutamine amidotransferase [Elongatibacter sediminis]|uniref:Gamma-glutamyl-gamma-aminobutyrate hydrolase family protein n=1 Tax=Elongatibacter sediminis TaxID=3119006 RepID=A0AAW9RJ97_9GAMM
MAKVLVFQHVAAEPLGTLDPMIRDRGHRIRYVNFHREPDARPDVTRYQALIILGGPQMPDQEDRYPHLRVEMQCIEEALKRDIPVLGICLGAQLIAYTLGGGVRALDGWELGWFHLEPTSQAAADPMFCALVEPHPVFQWHGYTFDLPAEAVHLARSAACENQAFRYGQNAYGLQCHLELDERLINRWLTHPDYRRELEIRGGGQDPASLREQTHALIGQSVELSYQVFGQFLRALGEPRARHVLPSR